jgi:putative ABC transport system permease protein
MADLRDEISGVRPLDYIRCALEGVQLRRVRSALTVTSFAAAAAAGVALLAITAGARQELLQRIEELGADLLSVQAVSSHPDRNPPPLSLADAEAIAASFPFLAEVSPLRSISATVLAPDDRVTVRVLGTTHEYFALRRLRFSRGRAFSEAEDSAGENVCVLGDAAARRLATQGAAYGSLIKLGSRWCRVVGVLSAGDAATGGETRGREIYLPLRATLRGDLSNRQGIDSMLLRVARGVDPEAAASIVERALARRHPERLRATVATAAGLLQQQRGARKLLDALLSAIAVLALALGGVTLAHQSWQGVAARTKEIAVRRAVGARRREILYQFLLEGVLLAGLGGALGTLLGAAGSRIAALQGGWPWLLPPLSVAAAIAVIVAIALAATLYPAYRAATLDPVATLRLEA